MDPLRSQKKSQLKFALTCIGVATFVGVAFWYGSHINPAVQNTSSEPERGVERTLVGSILEYQELESYIRFAVPEEGTYSIHITPATVITEKDRTLSYVPVDPLMETVIEVRSVEEGSPYDYEGISIKIKSLSDLNVEERANRLQVIDSMFVE